MRKRLVSLFAGVGGIELALEQEGFETVWANEIDKHACQTYRENFSHKNLVEGDIRQIKGDDIPPHDILVAGFPCQPFSMAQSHKKGLEHESGSLFKEIIRILAHHKPSWVLLENVKGLTFKNNKETFDTILNSLKDLGYKVSWKILNGKYFGVPQNRERLFIVGNRLDLDFQFPYGNKAPTKISDVLEKEVADKYYLSEKAWKGMVERKAKHVDANENKVFPALTIPHILQYRRNHFRENKENISFALTGNMGTGGHNVPFVILDENKWVEQNSGLVFSGYLNKNIRVNGTSPDTEHLSRVHKQVNRIYSTEGINPTLSNESRNYVYDKKAVRKLTPRECFRLQGFPDSFKLPKIADCHLYKQAGNSVVVPLLRRIGVKILYNE